MGLIRSGNTALIPEDDDDLTDYLWLIVREIIKTAFPMKNSDETEDYVNDSSNLELWTVNSALLYDPALSEFISAPYGTAIVRTASERFEADAPGKQIYIEKKQRNSE